MFVWGLNPIEADQRSNLTDVEASGPTIPTKTYLRRPKWFTPAFYYTTRAMVGVLRGSGAIEKHPSLGYVASAAGMSVMLLNMMLPDERHKINNWRGVVTSKAAELVTRAVLRSLIPQVQGPPVPRHVVAVPAPPLFVPEDRGTR